MKKLNGFQRIGPHPLDILSIIYGGLLGDVYSERRSFTTLNGVKIGNTRFCFKQGSPNVQYLLHNWKVFSSLGYCSNIKPKIKKSIGKKNKVYFHIRFTTWTYASFNFIHDLFYVKNKKIIPQYDTLNKIITPLALATWIMDDGSKRVGGGVLLHTNCFTHDEVKRLAKLLNEKFNLKTSVRCNRYFLLYIKKESMGLLRSIVSEYFSLDMMRKLEDS